MQKIKLVWLEVLAFMYLFSPYKFSFCFLIVIWLSILGIVTMITRPHVHAVQECWNGNTRSLRTHRWAWLKIFHSIFDASIWVRTCLIFSLFVLDVLTMVLSASELTLIEVWSAYQENLTFWKLYSHKYRTCYCYSSLVQREIIRVKL